MTEDIMVDLFGYRETARKEYNCLKCQNLYLNQADNEMRYQCMGCVSTRRHDVDENHICNMYKQKGSWS
jgi:DNA-directed RNA polymerase subunit RPC12/RpoP